MWLADDYVVRKWLAHEPHLDFIQVRRDAWSRTKHHQPAPSNPSPFRQELRVLCRAFLLAIVDRIRYSTSVSSRRYDSPAGSLTTQLLRASKQAFGLRLPSRHNILFISRDRLHRPELPATFLRVLSISFRLFYDRDKIPLDLLCHVHFRSVKIIEIHQHGELNICAF